MSKCIYALEGYWDIFDNSFIGVWNPVYVYFLYMFIFHYLDIIEPFCVDYFIA